MPEPFTWTTILPAIGFGGLVSALVTAFVNYVIKEREYYRDISKHKIEAISISKPYIIQLTRFYVQLSEQLRYGLSNGQDKIDYQMCMYFICNILKIHRKLLERFGDIQLDDLEAEDVLKTYKGKVIATLLSPFDNVEMYKLSYVFLDDDKTLSYNEFLENLILSRYSNQLYRKFENLLRSQLSMDMLRELEKNSTAYAQVLALEVNQTYEMWYKGGPTLKHFKNFGRLRKDIVEDLRVSNPCYFCRISEFDLGRKERVFSIIIRRKCYRCYLPKMLSMLINKLKKAR